MKLLLQNYNNVYNTHCIQKLVKVVAFKVYIFIIHIRMTNRKLQSVYQRFLLPQPEGKTAKLFNNPPNKVQMVSVNFSDEKMILEKCILMCMVSSNDYVVIHRIDQFFATCEKLQLVEKLPSVKFQLLTKYVLLRTLSFRSLLMNHKDALLKSSP